MSLGLHNIHTQPHVVLAERQRSGAVWQGIAVGEAPVLTRAALLHNVSAVGLDRLFKVSDAVSQSVHDQRQFPNQFSQADGAFHVR